MATGLQTTVVGASASPNLALKQATTDAVDRAALLLDPILRVDPRDVVKAGGTGKNTVHYTAPNRDPFYFSDDDGFSVGAISGKYDGKEVFNLLTGDKNNATVFAHSLRNKTAMSFVGVAHFDAEMLGSGFHTLLGLWRDGTAFEAMLAHQYSSTTNFLSAWSDQPAGSGGNYDMDGGSAIQAGTPFVYLFQVISGGGQKLFFNENLTDDRVSGGGSNAMEGGDIQLRIGWGASVSQQWDGGHGRLYAFDGDVLSTDDKRRSTQALILELKAYYGIA